jgi:hypothetical protein
MKKNTIPKDVLDVVNAKLSFHLGDTVYHPLWHSEPHVCKHCSATNFGKGRWEVEKSKITRITTTITQSTSEVCGITTPFITEYVAEHHYLLERRQRSQRRPRLVSTDMFRTRKECQLACSKENKLRRENKEA